MIAQLKDIKWKKPTLIESFSANGIDWSIYKDSYYKDFVINGKTKDYTIEITTQGSFTEEGIKRLLHSYKKAE